MLKQIHIQNITPFFYLISIVFIGLNSLFLAIGNYYFSLISVLLAIIYFSIFAFDKIYYSIIFLTPLSVSLSYYFDLPIDLSLPAEGLMIILCAILILKFISGSQFNKSYILHPVSISIIIYLLWMFITSITSSMPIISFKFLVAKLWFIIPMYFFSLLIFRNEKNMNFTIWLYLLPLLIVIFYTINRHIGYGLYDKQAAHIVMTPFYKDHTSYGAILSMYWPVLLGFLFQSKIKSLKKIFIFILLLIFSMAIVLSYTRAAWISLIAALFFGLFIYLKVKIRYLLILAFGILAALFIYRFEVNDRLAKNKQDSSTNLDEHVKSISNIATDASNKERINRWKSALAMFKEKPFWGWGPGTYMFQYAGFQMAKDKTIISTNFGEGGNAHSEYLSALIDSGVVGLLVFLLIIFFTLRSAIKVFYQSKNTQHKILLWSVMVGLVSYLIHGLLNNFLDTDKASVPFWIFIAIIVNMELIYKKNPQLGGAEER